MLSAVRSLELPEIAPTEWGVPVMDTDRLRRLTATPPTGFSAWTGKAVLVEWLDPQTGGVVCMLDTSNRGERFGELPDAESVAETAFRPHIEGLCPGVYDKKSPHYAATHLGLIVLANTPEITAVQLPGTNDYVTAYKHMNGGEAPGMFPEDALWPHPDGRDFLHLVADGVWPHDMHFFKAHAPFFVIGGRSFAEEVRTLAQGVSDESVDDRGGFIDDYTGVKQINWALGRIEAYQQTGDCDALYTGRTLANGCKRSLEAMTRFNEFAANILEVELPLDTKA